MANVYTDPQYSAITTALQANKSLQPGAVDYNYTQVVLLALQQPEKFGPILQRYGEGFSFSDFVLAMGSVNQITGRYNNYVYYELPKVAPFILHSQIAVQSAVGTFSAVFDNTESRIPRIGETFFVPATYMSAGSTPVITLNAKPAQVISRSQSGTTFTCTCGFLDNTAYITTAIPASTKLMVGAVLSAPGSKSPEGLVSKYDRANFGVSIFKEANEIEGGASGQTYLMGVDMAAKSAADMQWRMRKTMGIQMFAGEANTNTSVLTQNDIHGVAKPVLSADGLIPTLIKEGNIHFTSGNIDYSWFDTCRLMFEANGVVATNYAFLMGSQLYSNTQSGLTAYLKTQASYTDYTTPLGKRIKGLGFDVKEVTIAGLTFAMTVLRELVDPLTFGSNANYGQLGVIIPDQDVTVNQTNGIKGTAKFKNLNLCYLNDGGVLRNNIMCRYEGTTGKVELVGTDYDVSKTIMLTEAAHPTLLGNQMILVRPII